MSFRRSSSRKSEEKEYWRRKAKDEVLAVENEVQKIKSEEKQTIDWNRRLNEADWVLQGVPKMADKRMETVTAVEEEKATVKTLAGIKIDGERLRQKERERKKEKEDGKKKKIADQEGQDDKEDNQKGGFLGFFKFKNKDVEAEKEAEKMYRNEVLARKEMLAKAILEKEEREKRSEFLQENAQYIKILERSQFLLRSHRMPTHHQPQEVFLSNSALQGGTIPDFEVESAISEALREKNLRVYEPPVVERLDNGPSRSIDEVMKENRRWQSHIVPGRYHFNKGAEMLYPLRDFPATAKPLFPLGTHVVYPEDKLLGVDPNANAHHHHHHHSLSSAKLHTIRKSHLDMGKDSRLKESDRNHTSTSLIGREVVVLARPHTVGATAAESKGRNNGHKSTGSMFENDSKSFPPEVRYDLVSDARNNNPGGGGLPNRSSGMQKNTHTRMPAREEYAGNEGEDNDDDDYDFDIDNDNDNDNSIFLGAELTQQGSSGAATRSQFFSNGSISDAKKLIRVPMQRHRTARRLDQHHVAGGFSVMSLQRKKTIGKMLDATDQIQSGLNTNLLA